MRDPDELLEEIYRELTYFENRYRPPPLSVGMDDFSPYSSRSRDVSNYPEYQILKHMFRTAQEMDHLWRQKMSEMIIQAEDNAFLETLTRYTEAFDELLPYLSHKEECFFV